MNRRQFLTRAAVGGGAAAWAGGAGYVLFGGTGGPRLLNASYDATRELYRHVNRLFAERTAREDGTPTRVTPSHGGSGSQARAVVDGLPADVATLALYPDTFQLQKQKLIPAGWQKRLPHDSLPYTSTIVFAVRKGNPFGLRDWPDLLAKKARVVTPNPKTSGAAKLTVLALWGAVVRAGGSEAEADEFVRAVYLRVPSLETSARAATVTFARKGIGDVQLAWENEAWLERAESAGGIEVVYPSRSIRAEPHVTVVDAVVDRRGTRAAAERYARFLYDPAAQAVMAEQYLRPADPAGLTGAAADRVRAMTAGLADDAATLFSVRDLFPGDAWAAAQKRFFDEGALFDRIYSARG